LGGGGGRILFWRYTFISCRVSSWKVSNHHYRFPYHPFSCIMIYLETLFHSHATNFLSFNNKNIYINFYGRVHYLSNIHMVDMSIVLFTVIIIFTIWGKQGCYNNCLIDIGATKDIMPLEVMEALGMSYKKYYET
jgi:hypothetical protein